MGVIDTRLVEIDQLTKQHAQLAGQDPEAAAECLKKKEVLQQEYHKEVLPMMNLCKPWTFVS